MRQDLEILQGASDLHVHTSPDIVPRLMDHVEIAEHYRDYGFRAVLCKVHHFGTADRMPLVRRQVDGIDVFGGLALNYAVGGLNPFAVYYALKYGAKQIWLPTVDSRHHISELGASGQVGGGPAPDMPDFYTRAEGLTVLDDDGALRPELQPIFELIAEHRAILSCGHLSFEECLAVVDAATAAGVGKILVDHPNLFFTRLSVDQQRQLTSRGATMNYVFAEMSPTFHSISPGEMAANIAAVGPEHIVLSSDAGQMSNPPPAESLRMLAQGLLENGVPAEDLRQMLVRTPAHMLYDEEA